MGPGSHSSGLCCSGQHMWWTAMVKMDHEEAGSPVGASLLVLHSWDWWPDSCWIDSILPFAELCQEVVVVCTADPLQRICHFQGLTAYC